MKKLNIGDLEKIREKVRRTTNLRQGKARAKITTIIVGRTQFLLLIYHFPLVSKRSRI